MSRQRQRGRIVAGAGLSVTASLVTGAGAQAAEVDNLTDNPALTACNDNVGNDCSLRGAITGSNAGGDGYIYFQSGLTGTVTLTNGQIPITNDVYIYGPGGVFGGAPDSDDVSISGNNASRIFHIDPANEGDYVGIRGLRLTGGNAVKGGAIYNVDSTLQLRDVIISGNTATEDGGGLFESGLYYDGTYTDLRRTTINGNTAGDDGAGIYAADSIGSVDTSTIHNNNATGSGGGLYLGAVDDNAQLTGSTVSGNTAAGGGGVFTGDSVGAYSSIIANNTGGAAPDVSGDVELYYSLLENPAGANASSDHSITGQDPQLGTLQDNGGPTPTMLPALASPVIDQGSGTSFYDQRGVERPGGVDIPSVVDGDAGPYDMGAVELTLADAGLGNTTVRAEIYAYEPGSGGTVTATGINCTQVGGDCSESVAPGSTVVLTATPASGSAFDGWFGCDSAAGNQCTVEVETIDRNVEAYFETSPAPPGGGTTNPTIQPPAKKKKKCKKKKGKKGAAAAKKCKKKK
jgi:hypothetical protein